MIVVQNVSKSYNKRFILKDINFEIKPGEVTVVTGPSGGGKSTLIKVATLLEYPDFGSVSINGNHFNFPSKDKITLNHFPSVGVVFQRLFLWPHLSNRNNIMLPLGRNITPSQVNLLNELIDVFEMGEFIDRYPNQSSVGQQQRVAIARAIILKPKYLFLDEITSALDVEQIDGVLTYLMKLKDKGVGLLFVTHHLTLAQKAADQIIFIDNGKIIEKGNTEILISSKTLRFREFISKLDSKFIGSIEKPSLGQWINMWKDSVDPKKRMRYAYRMLDFSDLNAEMQMEIYQYIISNWEVFVDDALYWCELSRDNVNNNWDIIKEYIIKRLDNPNYPSLKKWIYLISFKLFPDYRSKKDEIGNILKRYLNVSDKLTCRIAQEMLNEL